MCEVNVFCERQPRWYVITELAKPMTVGVPGHQETINSRLSLCACTGHLPAALRSLAEKIPGGALVRQLALPKPPSGG
jgi:hypothetical protein